MKVQYAILFALSTLLFSCSSDSDTLMFEQARMLKLKIQSKGATYRIEGNEVNEVGYFFSKKKEHEFSKSMITGCKSTWSHAPVDFKVEFIHRSTETLRTKEVLTETTYDDQSSESKISVLFTYKDADGVIWTSESKSHKRDVSSLTINSIEPRYSPRNGAKKQQLNTSFNIWVTNEMGEAQQLTGTMSAVVEQYF